MATEVGLMARLMSGYGKETDAKGQKDPITRDLLGSCKVMDAKELDLGLSIGSGSAMDNQGPLDILQPGKMYLRNNNSNKPLQDLNLPPTNFSLNNPRSSPNNSLLIPSNYQSVCTIEKVKSALERMGRESESKSLARSDGSPSPSSSSITSSSPLKRQVDQIDGCDSSTLVTKGASLMAAACPNCLLYVLISKENPRCPRCDSQVPQPIITNNKYNGNNINNKKMKVNLDSDININTTLNLF